MKNTKPGKKSSAIFMVYGSIAALVVSAFFIEILHSTHS